MEKIENLIKEQQKEDRAIFIDDMIEEALPIFDQWQNGQLTDTEAYLKFAQSMRHLLVK